MTDEKVDDGEDTFENKYGGVLTPIIAFVIAILIVISGWWAIKIGMHVHLTGNFIEPAVRIVKTDKYTPMSWPMDKDRGWATEEKKHEEEYAVEYKTLDDGYWKLVCYSRCTLRFLDDAQERAEFVAFMLKKHRSPYNDENPQYNKIEIETVIPYKGDK